MYLMLLAFYISSYLLFDAHDDGCYEGHMKKRIMQQWVNSSRPYETDMSYEPCLDCKEPAVLFEWQYLVLSLGLWEK